MKTRVPVAITAMIAVLFSLVIFLVLDLSVVESQDTSGVDAPSAAPDLSKSYKQATPKVQAGDTIDFYIYLENSGDGDANGLYVYDIIPISTTYVVDSLSCTKNPCSYDAQQKMVKYQGALASGESMSISFQARVSPRACGTYIENQAVVYDPDLPTDELLETKTAVVGTIYNLWTFDLSSDGFTAGGSDWEHGTPTSGPMHAHSGTKLWATNLSGDYASEAMDVLWKSVSVPNDPYGVTLQWWEWYKIEEDYDFGNVVLDYTYVHTATGDSYGWRHRELDISAEAGKTITISFGFDADFGGQEAGWYIDDVAIHGGCAPPPDLSSSYKLATSKITERGEIDYSITINNSADGPANSATLTDPLPPGTTYQSNSVACTSGTCHYDTTEHAVKWAGTVAAHDYETIEFSVDATSVLCGDTITNTATISDGALSSPVTVEAATRVVRSLDFFSEFEGSDYGGFVTPISSDWEHGIPTSGPAYVPSGYNVWGTVLSGDYTSSHTSTMTKTMDIPLHPCGVSLQWWEWYEIESDWDNGWVRVSGAPIQKITGDSEGWVHRSRDISAYSGGTVDIEFELQTDGSNEFNGWFIDDLAVHPNCPPRPDLSSSYKMAPALVAEGDPISYTILITNTGAGDAEYASLLDPMPANADYVANTTTCNVGTCYYETSDGTIRWSGVISAGQYAAVRFAAKPSGTDCGDVITNTAHIEDGSLSGYTQAVATTTVQAKLHNFWDFENDKGGFVTGASTDWMWGSPFVGPPFPTSGSNLWGTDLLGTPLSGRTSMLTKTLTLPDEHTGVYLQWWEWYDLESGQASGTVIADDVAFHPISGNSQGWRSRAYDLLTLGHEPGDEIPIVFWYYSYGSGDYPGWYIDDVAVFGACPVPKLSINPSSLSAELCPGRTSTSDIELCNQGNAPMSWTVEETTTATLAGSATDVPWMSASPTTGSIQPDKCGTSTAEFDATGLTPGEYKAAFLVFTNAPGGGVSVPATLKVKANCTPGFDYKVHLPVVLRNH